jgi:hypothetical protein
VRGGYQQPETQHDWNERVETFGEAAARVAGRVSARARQRHDSIGRHRPCLANRSNGAIRISRARCFCRWFAARARACASGSRASAWVGVVRAHVLDRSPADPYPSAV